MNISTNLKDDIRSYKSGKGAYEWWYFDAICEDNGVEVVVIFYDGNPFSRRYIQHLTNGAGGTLASDFPAISISIYKDNRPVYYSFTEVERARATFDDDAPGAQIGEHQMKGEETNGVITYQLDLKEELPSGDAMEGKLSFTSKALKHNLFESAGDREGNHRWNLIQPRAKVSGMLCWSGLNQTSTQINFKGTGYHDHNMGGEPLKKEFDNWYWGRFHFEDATLIYYLTNASEQKDFGWLIDNNTQQLIQIFDELSISDYERNVLGLRSARKIHLRSDDTEAMVQQARILDNGPFYQRFSSDAFLNDMNGNRVLKSEGITEYLCPPRIYKRMYWPLTNMRIRYEKEAPHWVQRSKMLYRWTW